MLQDDFEVVFLITSTPHELVKKYLSEFPVEYIQNDEVNIYKRNFLKSDILVLDGYQFDSDYQAKVKACGVKLVYIDDLKAFRYSADVIINQADFVTPADYNAKPDTIFCLGPSYALLRRNFLKAAVEVRKVPEKITSVFISFGGADINNVTQKVLNALCSFEQLTEIHVLTGPVNLNVDTWKQQFTDSSRIHFHSDLSSSEVCELMKKCHLALLPASSLSLEVCAVGMVLLAGTTADNQKGYYRSLTEKSAALGVGEWNSLDENQLKEKISGILIYDQKDIDWFIKNQRKYIDGLSGERLLNVFLNLAA